MAKTIKFNLICDGHRVRTVEDLRNNFCIQDVLDYYNNKLLHRWLSVRGYPQLKAVSDITVSAPMEIIKELARIFDVVTDMQKVEESIYILSYLERRKEICTRYEHENYHINKIIDDYINGYLNLVREIYNNKANIALIKANISEIVSNYEGVLKLHFQTLFYALEKCSPLSIMCLLMNEKSRKYYLPTGFVDHSVIKSDADKINIYDKIKKMTTANGFVDSLGNNLKSYAANTPDYWNEVEPKGKKYMIISMQKGDYVRSAGPFGGDLSYDDVKDKFVIIDGICYKSNYKRHTLLYMEV